MKDIKAYQGYMSPPMKKFGWLKSFGLDPYANKTEPLVVFGCYKPVDRIVILKHRGPVIVIWMGTDTHKVRQELGRLVKKNIIHVTWLKGLHKYLTENRGIDCRMIKMPVKEYPKPDPVVLGNKVYAYLAKGKPEYHGSKIVAKLNLNGYPLLVGDDSINNNQWYNGESDKIYSQAFIGLALSSYVGGAMTIQEMAVRGIRVVTNVLDLPNCIPWKTREDVQRIIEEESLKIGQSNNGLAEEVYDSLVDIKGCFDLEKL